MYLIKIYYYLGLANIRNMKSILFFINFYPTCKQNLLF